ncbi:hypothetical protein PV08_10186 [Exophiala spinifera]|uniref:Ketoreductase domain-containing protein n=1 Tax=Exophiala spinifera TaxID=91928 RepID=A0A0D1ZD03_9EURO|nr:uncharacterized protein PV08_10186 [Exophiala spinifera]KIW10887.1 hypothetical protein PV08_10186 [Exophiala spinifera]
MPRTILITGCSDGGLGAALAIQFHRRGDRVFATARNPAKMASLTALGIETLKLDVLSDDSVKACVDEVSALTGGTLNMLINNAGAGYSMPIIDISLDDMEKLYRLNVFSVVRTTQLFFPLLRAAAPDATIVNQTSAATIITVPYQGAYGSSKAALDNLTQVLRLEMMPFRVKVVDLHTAAVKTHFFANVAQQPGSTLPPNSPYAVLKDKVQAVMNGDMEGVKQQDLDLWAKNVVNDLSKRNPSAQIWRGASATVVWLASFLPLGALDGTLKKMTGLDVLEKKVQEETSKKS